MLCCGIENGMTEARSSAPYPWDAWDRPTTWRPPVAFLVSKDADYITGADLSVNGGLGMEKGPGRLQAT